MPAGVVSGVLSAMMVVALTSLALTRYKRGEIVQDFRPKSDQMYQYQDLSVAPLVEVARTRTIDCGDKDAAGQSLKDLVNCPPEVRTKAKHGIIELLFRKHDANGDASHDRQHVQSDSAGYARVEHPVNILVVHSNIPLGSADVERNSENRANNQISERRKHKYRNRADRRKYQDLSDNTNFDQKNAEFDQNNSNDRDFVHLIAADPRHRHLVKSDRQIIEKLENDLKVSTNNERREKVKEMMQHAWRGYTRYAWGKNELRPVSRTAHSGSIFGPADLGASIVDGLDTLYLMGLHTEYRQARQWVQDNFTLEGLNSELSVFETNIRFVGGFLSMFALTGDELYRSRAQQVADKLLPAFRTPTGIPHALVNVQTGASKNYPWAGGFSSILSEFGTLHLEFTYLSDVTGNREYRDRVMHIRKVVKQLDKVNGLYPNYLNPKTGKWGQHHMSLGALGDSFFEYLLKAWLQSGKEDVEAREMYDEAMAAITDKMIKRSPQSGLTYVAELKYDRVEHKMDHLACFAGGLYGLGSQTLDNRVSDQYLEIGEALTNTCHESYDRTPVKLGPESFRFTEAVEAKAIKSGEKYYILRPELIESYFVLWRLTKNQKYRDWGWEAVEALEKHCRAGSGFSGIKNVYLEDPPKDDVQQSFYLAETLKYLYLLYSDDSLLPLDEWVFNTEAHPLPIKGSNPLYREFETTQDE